MEWFFSKIYDFLYGQLIDPWFKNKQTQKESEDKEKKLSKDSDKIYQSMIKYNQDLLPKTPFGKTAHDISFNPGLHNFSEDYINTCLKFLKNEGKVDFQGRTEKPPLWSVVTKDKIK